MGTAISAKQILQVFMSSNRSRLSSRVSSRSIPRAPLAAAQAPADSSSSIGRQGSRSRQGYGPRRQSTHRQPMRCGVCWRRMPASEGGSRSSRSRWRPTSLPKRCPAVGAWCRLLLLPGCCPFLDLPLNIFLITMHTMKVQMPGLSRMRRCLQGLPTIDALASPCRPPMP